MFFILQLLVISDRQRKAFSLCNLCTDIQKHGEIEYVVFFLLFWAVLNQSE